MANTLTKSEKYASYMQGQIRQAFVWKYIADLKFEWDFEWNKTVHFKRQAKVVYSDMANSYVEIPTVALTQTDETFTLSTMKWFSVVISDLDYKEIDINPDSQVLKDAIEQSAKLYDTAIMAQVINAWLTITDWDMTTATNWGWTNSIKLSASNMLDLIAVVNEKLDTAPDSLWNATWVPDTDRWVMLSPKEKRFLNVQLMTRATALWDKVVTWGFLWDIDGTKIYYSNNILTSATVRSAMFGQWKPICFGALIKPKVEFVWSETQANSFINTMKSMTYYWAKVFDEGAERLGNIKIWVS